MTHNTDSVGERRPLRDDERALLDHLLKVEIPGIEQLRAQAGQAQALPSPRLPSSLEIFVPESTPPARAVQKQVPIHAHSVREDEHGFHVTLWMSGDYLDHIEVSWYETPPTRLPRPDELKPAEPF